MTGDTLHASINEGNSHDILQQIKTVLYYYIKIFKENE